jgi:hypothetical protein
MINLEFLPNAPELLLVFTDPRVAKLAQMLIDTACALVFSHFTLHLGKPKAHLGKLRTAFQKIALDCTFEKLACATYTIIFSCFSYLKVHYLIALLWHTCSTHFLGSSIVDLHGMGEESKIFLVVSVHIEEYFGLLGRYL